MPRPLHNDFLAKRTTIQPNVPLSGHQVNMQNLYAPPLSFSKTILPAAHAPTKTYTRPCRIFQNRSPGSAFTSKSASRPRERTLVAAAAAAPELKIHGRCIRVRRGGPLAERPSCRAAFQKRGNRVCVLLFTELWRIKGQFARVIWSWNFQRWKVLRMRWAGADSLFWIACVFYRRKMRSMMMKRGKYPQSPLKCLVGSNEVGVR